MVEYSYVWLYLSNEQLNEATAMGRNQPSAIGQERTFISHIHGMSSIKSVSNTSCLTKVSKIRNSEAEFIAHDYPLSTAN